MQATLPSVKYLNECFTLVEDNDYEAHLVWKVRPAHHFATLQGQATTNGRQANKVAGCEKRHKDTTYLVVNINATVYYVHRIIWKMRKRKDPGVKIIDHENGNGLQNGERNLRLVTNQVNCQNVALRRNNKSGVHGVSYDKRRGSWRAYIKVDYRQIGLGYYASKSKAVKARKRAEVKYGFHENHGRS